MQGDAERRNFMIGMSLNEVVFLVLFILLLGSAILLNNKEQKLNDSITELVDKKKEFDEIQKINSELDNLKKRLESIIVNLENDLKKRKSEHEKLKSLLEETNKKYLALIKHVKDEDKLSDLLSQIRELTGKLEEGEITKEQQGKLIATLKAGSPPPCIYLPHKNKLKGSSVSLGTIYITNDNLKLVKVNPAINNEGLVNYAGNPTSADKAYEKIMEWKKLNKPKSSEQYIEFGTFFLDLGNNQNYNNLKCRYTMDYIIEDYKTKHEMLKSVFEKIFLSQNRLSYDDYKNENKKNTPSLSQ